MEGIAATDRAGIIVVEVSRPNGGGPHRGMVDFVSEVLNVKAGDIEEAPDFGVKLDPDYILG